MHTKTDNGYHMMSKHYCDLNCGLKNNFNFFSVEQIRRKTQYIKDLGIGGAMIW
jgi:hypothetical protein